MHSNSVSSGWHFRLDWRWYGKGWGENSLNLCFLLYSSGASPFFNRFCVLTYLHSILAVRAKAIYYTVPYIFTWLILSSLANSAACINYLCSRLFKLLGRKMSTYKKNSLSSRSPSSCLLQPFKTECACPVGFPCTLTSCRSQVTRLYISAVVWVVACMEELHLLRYTGKDNLLWIVPVRAFLLSSTSTLLGTVTKKRTLHH